MKILLTSAGGLVGSFLIEHFRKISRDFYIIATDMSELVPAKYWANEFYKVPASGAPEFRQVIADIVNDCNPEIIIPITSFDVAEFASPALYGKFYKKLLIMESHHISTLHLKASSYKFLRSIGIAVPELFTENSFNYPCVLKPNSGTGSKNTYIIREKMDYEYLKECVKDFILCEYLPGDEFTVDCLFDKKGICIGANSRQRIKQAGGGAVISKNSPNENVIDIVEKLEKLGWIVGPVNFQYKRNDKGIPVVFDFNTRLASGGLALTVQSGFDIPMLIIDIVSGKTVKKWYGPEETKSQLIMIKYYKEMFVSE